MLSQDQAPDTFPEATRAHGSEDTILLDTGGKRHRLSDFRGSPVVLVFHTPEWDPTRVELVEAYNRIVAHIPHGGGRLVSIAPDAPWHALAFAGDEPVSVPIIVSDALDLRRRYDIDSRPAVILLDGNGNVRWRHTATHALPRPDVLASALDALAPDALAPDTGENVPVRSSSWTRREFVATILAAGVVLMLPLRPALAQSATAGTRTSTETLMDDHAPGSVIAITLNVNGRNIPLAIEPRVTLLDALREYAGLTGTKKGCDHGQCGACTVHIDGRRVLSCLTLAMMAQGKSVTTIEGIATGSETDVQALHPMQRAFLAHDGFQCGYCTPGQIMSATAMLNEPWGPADADAEEAMSGNICRCGAYPGIVAAVQEVRKQNGARKGA